MELHLCFSHTTSLCAKLYLHTNTLPFRITQHIANLWRNDRRKLKNPWGKGRHQVQWSVYPDRSGSVMKTPRCLKCLTFTQQPARRFPFSLHTFQYLLLSNVAVLKYCSHLMIRSMAATLYGPQCKSGIWMLPPQTYEIRPPSSWFRSPLEVWMFVLFYEGTGIRGRIHAMRAYRRSGGTPPHINLDTRWT
jgi:hypothetical protein